MRRFVINGELLMAGGGGAGHKGPVSTRVTPRIRDTANVRPGKPPGAAASPDRDPGSAPVPPAPPLSRCAPVGSGSGSESPSGSRSRFTRTGPAGAAEPQEEPVPVPGSRLIRAGSTGSGRAWPGSAASRRPRSRSASRRPRERSVSPSRRLRDDPRAAADDDDDEEEEEPPPRGAARGSRSRFPRLDIPHSARRGRGHTGGRGHAGGRSQTTQRDRVRMRCLPTGSSATASSLIRMRATAGPVRAPPAPAQCGAPTPARARGAAAAGGAFKGAASR